ncbi:hypothetical protein HRG_014867 [Hirsutella rhossiliensis]
MPSDRVSKKRAKASSSIRCGVLLSTILSNPDILTMPSCSACERRGLRECQVSSSDSDRCVECVRLHLPRCDVQGVSPAQLRNIANQHIKLERELEEAEEKVLRLRKQKKLWFEKMMRAVSRGIDNVEELERVEKEEAEKERQRVEEARPPSPHDDRPIWVARDSSAPENPISSGG